MPNNKQDVFKTLRALPNVDTQELYRLHPTIKHESIRNYKSQYLKLHPTSYKTYTPNTIKDQPEDDCNEINIKHELIKIIKDYKNPSSSRVQAIREYNNIIEKNPIENKDDSLLRLFNLVEREEIKEESYDDPNFHLYKKNKKVSENSK